MRIIGETTLINMSARADAAKTVPAAPPPDWATFYWVDVEALLAENKLLNQDLASIDQARRLIKRLLGDNQ